MILDKLSMFCWGFQFPSFTTAYSTDADSTHAIELEGHAAGGYIDLGATDQFATLGNQGTEKWGVGGGLSNDLYLAAIVYTAMNDHPTTPVATVAVTLETADDAAFSGNLTTIMTLGTFPAASKVGTMLAQQLPANADYRRYLRVKFTVAGGPLTAGRFTALIATALQLSHTYPQRSSIVAG